MIITNEMVDLARAKIFADCFISTEDMRAALEAVAPLLIAEELRAIADKIYNRDADIAETILARAQELEK